MSTMREKFSQWLGANSQHVDSVTEQFMFEAWQAATEAAKATGTAGELPPLPEPSFMWRHEDACGSEIGPADPYYTLDQMRTYGQACTEAARQPAPVVAGCEFCGSAIGHDLDCQNHPVNVKAPFQQDDEHKAFMATYLYAARKASDNTSAGMILWHANRHWNGKAGEMWRARAALAATAAPVLSDERIDWLANCACPGGTAYPSQVKAAIRDALREASINRSQP